MDANLQHELLKIAQAFRWQSDDSFSFADGPVFHASDRVQFYPANVELTDEPMLIVMRRVIYFQCFIRPFLGKLAVDDPDTGVDQTDPNEFLLRLSNSNRGVFRWDPYWRVYRVGVDGELHVQKGDVHHFVVPGAYAFDAGPGLRPIVGDLVNLQVLTESFSFQENYYFCFGEEIGDEFDDFSKVRFYFNVSPEVAPALLEFITTELNRFQIPFRFKCPKDPNNYDRRDTAVLYVASRWFQITSQILSEFSDAPRSNFDLGVPLFCRELWPGVGFAEDPEGSESFGETRCNLVAKGIQQAWQQTHEPTDEQFLQSIQSEFERADISLDRPWLNAGTINDYEVPHASEFSSLKEIGQ